MSGPPIVTLKDPSYFTESMPKGSYWDELPGARFSSPPPPAIGARRGTLEEGRALAARLREGLAAAGVPVEG